MIMRIWSASAVDRYYRDPRIEYLRGGDRPNGKRPAAGYYIVPHRRPDDCQAFEGISPIDLGPFATRANARNWSRRYLVEPGTG